MNCRACQATKAPNFKAQHQLQGSHQSWHTHYVVAWTILEVVAHALQTLCLELRGELPTPTEQLHRVQVPIHRAGILNVRNHHENDHGNSVVNQPAPCGFTHARRPFRCHDVWHKCAQESCPLMTKTARYTQHNTSSDESMPVMGYEFCQTVVAASE